MVFEFSVKMSPTRFYALRNVLQPNLESGFVGFLESNSSDFMICQNSLSDVLDVRQAKDDGYGVSRFRNLRAGDYSIMMFPAGSFFAFVTMDAQGVTDEFGFNCLEASRDALKSLGLDAVIDQHSSQTNDVVIKGKKVSAYADRTVDGWKFVGFFITLDFDYSMADYVSLPDSKFDGKFSDSIRERVSGVSEYDGTITVSDVRSSVKEALTDHTPIETYTSNNHRGKVTKNEVDTEEQYMRQESYVHSY